MKNGIPADGEHSDIDSDLAESDGEISDDIGTAVEDEEDSNLDDLHAIDVVESEDNTVKPQVGKLT